MKTERSYVPAVLDREIETSEADAFGHRHFAAVLRGLIESKDIQPPFSIGLLGTWGSGKSSIKSIYESSLADSVAGDSSQRPVMPITFNAWRFGGEDIKRALLREVYLELGGDRNELDEALFRHVQRSQPQRREFVEMFKDAFDQWGWTLCQALFVVLVVVGTAAATIRFTGLSSDQVIGWILGASVVVAGALAKFLLDASRITRHANVTRIEPPKSSAHEYEDLLLAQIDKFKRKAGKHCERLVIFVDDLDRLSAEEMISGLDAVRTFMEIPKGALPKGLGIVFVISCDEDRLADALAKRRNGRNELPAAVFSRNDARRYLDRIFQFRLEIPPFPKRDMRSFAQEHLTKALPSVVEELKSVGTSLDALIDRMIHVGVATPRNALQIVNAFLQSWWVAQKREHDGTGSDRPGGLQEGSVTKHPISLGAICALRVDFPEFYHDLQREPDLIRRFTDVFIRSLPIANQPDSTQVILRKYANDEDASDVSSANRPLRQFISSLRGIRWPRSLRPLLVLSQDPVTRKFGDKALELHEAFVSGDHLGVLAELGRNYDKKPLSNADMRLLHDMVEDLERESDVRRNNAASVLAELSERYPPESAHLLLSPLARRLSESAELRWRLGVENIGRAIAPTTLRDKQAVACRLIDDLLRPEGPIEFRLESGEAPSLQEALEMAQSACTLVLSVREAGELPPPHDETFLDWLVSRRVEIGDKEHGLPFSQLDTWMLDHEDWLLPLLGERYTGLLANELQSENADQSDEECVTRRVRQVMTSLWDAGEVSRPTIWRQLTEFVSVRMQSVVAFASDFVGDHVTSPDADNITDFVRAFAGRVAKATEDEDWSIDHQLRGRVLIDIVRQRADDLGDDAEQSLQDVLSSWSLEETTGELAAQLIDTLYTRFPTTGDTIATDWQSRLLDDLPESCGNWLAANFGSLVDQHRQQVVSRLDTMYKRDNVPDEEAKRYRKFVKALGSVGLAADEMQTHIRNLFTHVGQRHANPNNYLYRVFPAVVSMLGEAPPDASGSMIHTLFANTKGNPELFGWLHHWIRDKWPEPSTENAPYEPSSIFNEAYSVAKNHAGTKWSFGLLQSMAALVKSDKVGQESARVAEIACVVWPHHPEKAIQCLEEIDATPTPQQAADVLEALTMSDEDEIGHLEAFWNITARRFSNEEQIETAEAILAMNAIGTDEQPDQGLRTWLNQMAENEPAVLQSLISNESLNDEQRKRVWLQIEASEKDLDKEFFLSVIPTVSAFTDNSGTLTEVFDFEQPISSKFVSADDKHLLGKVLVTSFRTTSSKEGRKRFAQWMKNLGADGVLKEIGDPSSDEIEILEPHFSKSRHWKALAKKAKSEQK